MDLPTTQFVESDGLSIAYQVFGEGAQDLVYVPGTVSNVDMAWQDPAYSDFLKRLGSIFRVITLDKRGQGMSDAIAGEPTLDERMDDVRAVMEAAGSERAILFGTSEGGPMSILFAATYPEKVERLILFGSMPRLTAAHDYPHSPPREEVIDFMTRAWGTPEFLKIFAPDYADDEATVEWACRFMRQTCSPSALKRLYVANANIDVRPILPDIRVPTLILHRRFERAVYRGNARYMAEHMPEAIYIELPGRNHICWLGDVAGLVDAIAHFAKADAPTRQEADGSRRLVTALFTDIVGSTEALARLGDARWRELLDRHDATARSKVDEYQGRFVKSTGDGMLAVFGGPTRAILCARDLSESLAGLELPIRCGLHVGEVETRGEDVSGMAVHIAARIMDHADAGDVLVSRTLADLTVGSGLAMETAGRHAFKGLPGEIEVLRVGAAH